MKKTLIKFLEKLHRQLESFLYEERYCELEHRAFLLERENDKLRDKAEFWKDQYHERRWA